MPRPPRVDAAGILHHITSRGNRRQRIFGGGTDADVFLSMLGRVAGRHEWAVLAYCLMPNHLHLLVETHQPTLSAGMQWLKGSYGRYFNDVHGLDGHLFQGRFKSTVVENDWHLFELGRYLALNPVRGGLATTPEAWRWSSYAATIGRALGPPFLKTSDFLRHFAADREIAIARFSRFVRDGLDS